MSVSILIPTYKRKQFEKLMNINIKTQTYPLIKEIIIADDGEDENILLDLPYTILYYKTTRMSIGEKRNFLKSKASGDYLIHMDTDDFYHPEYVSNSVFNLISTGKELSGSADMIMYFDEKTYLLRCIYLTSLNEATLCYTKKYAEDNHFSSGNSSEGLTFCKLKHISELNINKIMMCICHSQNTINKKIWVDDKYLIDFDLTIYKKHLEILSDVIL